MRHLQVVAVLILGLLLAIAPATSGAASQPVTIQILDVSDWHAQLDPLSVSGVNVGGAAVISSYWKADRAANPSTLTLTAGDAFGASPPLSGFFNEEPAVRAMRLMGFDADTFGNHNFDRGIAHLQQMIDLAGASPAAVPGKPFRYLSANLKNVDDNLSGVAPWAIFDVGGVEVGVVGITNPEAPTLVFPGSFGTIEVTNPIQAANKAKAAAIAAGAKVLVAITHLGVTGSDTSGNAVGPLIDFAENVGGFNVIFGDHTDFQFSGVINNALVIENKSKGATYSRTQLTVDPETGRVVSRSNTFVVPVAASVTPDPAIVDMLAPFRTELAVAFDRKIGVATALFPRGENLERREEVAIGNLIADSMRLKYGTQLGLTNSGGIRSPLPSSYLPMDLTLRRTAPPYVVGPPFDLVVGDVFTVLPFGNQTVTRTVTGAQLWAALENGVSMFNPDGTNASGRFPQISGFRLTFHFTNSVGSRIESVSLNDGTPILPDATLYTLALPDFVNAGGDGYTIFADGQGVTRDLMANDLLERIEALGTITPTIEGRITKLP